GLAPPPGRERRCSAAAGCRPDAACRCPRDKESADPAAPAAPNPHVPAPPRVGRRTVRQRSSAAPSPWPDCILSALDPGSCPAQRNPAPRKPGASIHGPPLGGAKRCFAERHRLALAPGGSPLFGQCPAWVMRRGVLVPGRGPSGTPSVLFV